MELSTSVTTAMSVSWLLLTYNRADTVRKAFAHCARNAGRDYGELVWVDNGSAASERDAIARCLDEHARAPVTKIHFPENRGVAKGYNACLGNARGTHVVITGCDMLMPDGWLQSMARCFDTIARTGIVTIYAAPIGETPERIRGPLETVNGIELQPAMPIGRRMLSRELLSRIGYFNEGFGMYGWDDVAWGHRAEKICREENLRFYNLPDLIAQHLGTEGNAAYDSKDAQAYWRWKKSQVDDPAKQQLLKALEARGWPRFSPFP